ncbi:MAG: hypothetical protein RMJ04_10650 [Geminicoccaceae bacterium]|nr:hypothetical protein [Geminicoccaceae bacterium]MDW8125219.1 hypothetical protein [Geminicoccaceae bacterium]
MSYTTYETIQRLWQQFAQDQLAHLPPEQRAELRAAFEARFGELLAKAAGEDGGAFVDLLGFGKEGLKPFGEVPYPFLAADFDEAVVPSQLHAAAELYFIYQHERMGVFRVAAVLRQLFREGRIRIQRGPGARMLYTIEKWQPLRYGPKDRMAAYKRVFNYGRQPPPVGGIVNRNFHYQLVALMSALAQYYRDLTIAEVIRGAARIDQKPYGNIASVQRLGIDLRYALDRASYGNIVALAIEVGMYLKQLLELFDTPDIRKAFDANTKWDVLEQVLNRFLGGARELSQRAKMAEAGRRVLLWVAGNKFESDIDPQLFQIEARPAGAAAEAWIAAYRLTEEGRRFPGVADTLRWAVGLPPRAAEAPVLG